MFMVDFIESMSFLLLHCPNLQQKLNFATKAWATVALEQTFLTSKIWQ